MALTEKKRLFAEALFNGASKKDAAIASGSKVTSAGSVGSIYSRDKDVIAYLDQLRSSAPAPSDDARLPGTTFDDPGEFMKFAMNHPLESSKFRLEAAKALAQHQRGSMPIVDKRVGKKQLQQEAASEVAQSRFRPSAPPPLKKVVG